MLLLLSLLFHWLMMAPQYLILDPPQCRMISHSMMTHPCMMGPLVTLHDQAQQIGEATAAHLDVPALQHLK